MQHIMPADMPQCCVCSLSAANLPKVCAPCACTSVDRSQRGKPQSVIQKQDVSTGLSDALTPGCARRQMAIAIIVMVCIFTSGFAWSWGPLGWLVPSEIQPLETRSTGQAITVSTNFIFTAVIGQAFLTMLCTMQVQPGPAQFAPCEPAQSV